MDTHGSVRLATMFCAAHDRNVPILFRHERPELRPDIWAGSGDPLHCLDYGVRCNGWLCPHFAVPEFPKRSLLERAMNAERTRGGRGVTERRAVLERSLRADHRRGRRALAELSLGEAEGR